MRTTIRIDDEVYRRVKAKAARLGRPVAELIEEAVRDSLRTSPREARPVEPLPVFGGSGTQPGVDLGSNAAVRDVMDEGVALHARR
jgi:hypothetical protein